jgi:hypothetical protein
MKKFCIMKNNIRKISYKHQMLTVNLCFPLLPHDKIIQ